MSERPMQIRRIVIDVCEACLRGQGAMCHTPECALCRHTVDLPIHREVYTIVHLYDSASETTKLPEEEVTVP